MALFFPYYAMNEIALKSVLVRHGVRTDHLSYEISNQALSPLVEWAKNKRAAVFAGCARIYNLWQLINPGVVFLPSGSNEN